MNAPDSRDAWAAPGLAARGALICASMFSAVGLYSMGVALPALETAFAGSTPGAAMMVQIVGGIVAPAFALASPLAGRCIGKYGVRAVYLASIVLFVIGGLGPMLCSALLPMLPFRLILALGVAGGMTAGYAGIARLPGPQRQILLGLMSFVGGAISIVAFPITGALAAESWRLAFLIHLILIPLALLALALPKHDAPPADSAEGSSAGKLAGVPVLLLLTTALGGWGIMASAIYSPFYLGSIGVADPARTGQVLSAMAVCSLIGSGSYGFVHRLLGTRGMLLLGLALSGGGCLVIAMNSAIPGVIVGLGMLGAGISVFAAAAYATAIEAIGPSGNVGGAMGIMNLAMFGPQILFPPIATPLGAAAGPATVYIALAVAFGLFIALIFVRPFRSTTALAAG